MRHNVIDMVLATEMAKHFEHLQRFIHICKANIKNADEDLSVKVNMRSTTFQNCCIEKKGQSWNSRYANWIA